VEPAGGIRHPGVAERVLRRARHVVQASLNSKQRLRQQFFPEGVASDETRFNRTAATGPLFNLLRSAASTVEGVVTQIFTSWNPLTSWLRQVDRLRHAAA
jgi:hypothetical protein